MNMMLRLLIARRDYGQTSGRLATTARVGSAVAAELQQWIHELIQGNEQYINPVREPGSEHLHLGGMDICEDVTLPPDAIVVEAPERPKA